MKRWRGLGITYDSHRKDGLQETAPPCPWKRYAGAAGGGCSAVMRQLEEAKIEDARLIL